MKPEPEPTIPWVLLDTSSGGSHIRVVCERCKVILSFPCKYPAHRAEGFIWNFRMDHKDCR